MAKKDFSNTKSRVQNTIAEATQEIMESPITQDEPATHKERRTYTEQEAQVFMSMQGTSGRKGLKLPRINMAFTPENYEYIQTMARVRGETLTSFVNAIVKKSLQENQDLYHHAVEFRKQFL